VGRLYYGWWVTGACFLFVAARRGSETAYGVLLVALVHEFGWERASITGAFSLAMLVAGFLSPLAGRCLDRFDPRLPFGVGVLALGLSALALAAISRVTHLYLTMAVLFSLALALLELGTLSAFLARWFIRRRALAFGLSQAGQGLGIFVLTPLIGWLITVAGWRTGYALLGAGLLLLLMPVNLLVLRATPQRLGLVPDGDAAPPYPSEGPVRHSRANVTTGTWTLAQARRTRVFWALLLCFYFFPASNQVFHIHLVAHLTDLGIDKLAAAFVLSLVGLSSIPGRLVFGVLTDRYGGIVATQLSFGLSVLAVVLIMLPHAASPFVLYPFAITFGLSLGSRGVTLGALTADTFPGREFGAIYGWITSGQLIGGALGPWLAGLIFDRTGSYQMAFYGCIAGFVCSALLVGVAALGNRQATLLSCRS
jgi:MFS family permease